MTKTYEDSALEYLEYAEEQQIVSQREYYVQVAQVYATLALLEKKK